MSHPLDKDIAAYEAMLPELKVHHKGKHVLFFKGGFVDAFDSFDNAAAFATANYGKGPYLIRFVGQSTTFNMPASVAFRPASANC